MLEIYRGNRHRHRYRRLDGGTKLRQKERDCTCDERTEVRENVVMPSLGITSFDFCTFTSVIPDQAKTLLAWVFVLSSSWVWLLMPWIRCTVEQNATILNNVLGLNVKYNIARTSEFQEYLNFFLDRSSFSLRTHPITEWIQHVFSRAFLWWWYG